MHGRGIALSMDLAKSDRARLEVEMASEGRVAMA